jgi:Cdc6-like AAA superfamily ATPase
MTDLPELSMHSTKVAQMLIQTPSLERIQCCLEEALREAGTTATPSYKHIVGLSRTGRSFALRDFEARYPAVRHQHGLRKEVIYVQTPPSGTVKGLMGSLLEVLGDPMWMSGTYSSLLSRLQTLLKAVQCRLVILDEFQHLVDKGQKRTLIGTTDWLKSLVERSSFSLVAVGLPSSSTIIFQNEQLRNRFDATISIKPYDWFDPSSRMQFRSLLHSIEVAIAPFEVPPLASEELALRLFLASSGRIGLLTRILDRAVRTATDESTCRTSTTHTARRSGPRRCVPLPKAHSWPSSRPGISRHCTKDCRA